MSSKKPKRAKKRAKRSRVPVGNGGGESDSRRGAEAAAGATVTEDPQPLRGATADTEPAEAQESAETEPTVPLEQHQRLLAEFDNYRKRTDRERARLGTLVAGDLALQLLPVLDDFERAEIALAPDETTFDCEGILIIRRRLAEALEREGLREVEASPGDHFDPKIHEAVLTASSDVHTEGYLAEVLQKGYFFGDRLLRASRVVVSSGPAREPAGTDGED